MELKVIEGGRGWDELFEPLPFSLMQQPQRPGEICESVRLHWPEARLELARALAAQAQIPIALWLSIAVEGQRALELVCEAAGIDSARLARAADESAGAGELVEIRPRAARRLGEYGAALRRGDLRFAEPEKRAPLLRVSHTVLAGWSLAAAASGRTIEEWIVSRELIGGRQLWEAAAAESGQQLEGWLFAQAARLARSRNT